MALYMVIDFFWNENSVALKGDYTKMVDRYTID